MANSNSANRKGGLQTSFVSIVVTVALMLTLLGLVIAIVLSVGTLKRKVKEQIHIDLFFDATLNADDIRQIADDIAALEGIRRVEFITPERAWEEFEKISRDTKDTVNAFDLSLIDNVIPIPPSINLSPTAEYATLENVDKLERDLKQRYPQLEEFNVSRDTLRDVNLGFDKLIYLILLIASLLMVITFALINNTIRLALYSQRFIIKTQQLVGATSAFIRRPFLLQAILQGVLAAFVAMALLFAILYLINNYVQDLSGLIDIVLMLKLFAAVVVLGIIICFFATNWALSKYLRMSLDDLY
jgi:cell division transport system permease protein